MDAVTWFRAWGMPEQFIAQELEVRNETLIKTKIVNFGNGTSDPHHTSFCYFLVINVFVFLVYEGSILLE